MLHLKDYARLLTSVHQSKMTLKHMFSCWKNESCAKKQLSIPRLELQAAVLPPRIKNNILQTHRNTANKAYIGSDFSTVLA